MYLVRFFIVAPPVPALMIGAIAAATVVAAIVLLVDPGRGAAAVAPIVVLQLFASASGFAGPARRGHYDLLLTRGEGRLRVALAHWLVSIGPGLAAWIVVGTVEIATAGALNRAVFTSGTASAWLLVSTLPWAIAVRQPRFAPSIGWVLVVATAPAVLPSPTLTAALRMAVEGEPAYLAAAAFLLYPLAVVGQPLRPEAALVVAPGLAMASAAMVVSIRWIVRAGFPLEASQ